MCTGTDPEASHSRGVGQQTLRSLSSTEQSLQWGVESRWAGAGRDGEDWICREGPCCAGIRRQGEGLYSGCCTELRASAGAQREGATWHQAQWVRNTQTHKYRQNRGNELEKNSDPQDLSQWHHINTDPDLHNKSHPVFRLFYCNTAADANIVLVLANRGVMQPYHRYQSDKITVIETPDQHAASVLVNHTWRQHKNDRLFSSGVNKRPSPTEWCLYATNQSLLLY